MRKKTRGRGRGRPPALTINNDAAAAAEEDAADEDDADDADDEDGGGGGGTVDTREDELRKSLKRKYASSILSLKVRARKRSPGLKKREGKGGGGEFISKHFVIKDHGDQTSINI